MSHSSPSSTLFPYTTLFRSQRDGSTLSRMFWVAFARPRKLRGETSKLGILSRSRSFRRRLLGFLAGSVIVGWARSEEHTSELQSLRHLVCRLLLEKKKNHTR